MANRAIPFCMFRYAASRTPRRDASRTPHCDALRTDGAWNPNWSPIYERNPELTESFISVGISPTLIGRVRSPNHLH